MSNLINLDRIPSIIEDRIQKYIEEFETESDEPRPVSIVYGTWGVGKSTLLKQIKKNENNEHKALVIRLDAAADAGFLSEQLNSEYFLKKIETAKKGDDVFCKFGRLYKKYISDDMGLQMQAIKNMLIFPVVIVIDQWDLLPKTHPCYNIPMVHNNKAPLYIVAGSGSWNPKLSICSDRYNEYKKLFMDDLYVHVGALTEAEFKSVKATNPSRIKMSREMIFIKSNGIFRLVNSIIYSEESECDDIIDSQLVGNVDRVLLRAKDEYNEWARKETIDNLATMLRYSETDNDVELPKEFCRISGIVSDQSDKFSHPRFQNAIKKVLLEDNVLITLFQILAQLGLDPDVNHSMLGTYFEAIFWKQSKNIMTLKLVCEKPCVTNCKKAIKESFDELMDGGILTLQWESVESLDKSTDLQNHKNTYGVLIKMSPNFPLVDFVLAKEVGNEVHIYAIQVTIQSYEEHKMTEEYYDEQAIRCYKYGIKRKGDGGFMTRFGMKNQTIRDLLIQTFSNGKAAKVIYVFISPKQTKLPSKNCFYIPQTKWFSASDTWVKRYLDAAKLEIVK
eukprot:NODE_9_length_47730_cov_0.323718.p4 type:complete len:561 gc:universal NODE_9_length_47730_cov_0.323718:39226-40908(+)